MNYSYSVTALCQLLQGEATHLSPQASFQRVSIDSRKTAPGDLFVALRGENTDGHLYIQQALDKGAKGILANVERLPPPLAAFPIPLIAVQDPNHAFMEIAQDYRARFTKGRVLGITGSNGKTSSKEIAAGVCRASGDKTHATEGNFNNFVGVPLTVLAATLEEAWWVIEMGTNHFGEIATLSQLVKPDLGMITNIGESHLEFLENTQGVAREKAGLFAGMAAHSWVAIPATLLHQEIVFEYAAQAQIQLVTFGFEHWVLSKPADYLAKLLSRSSTHTQFEWLGHRFETPMGNPLLLSNLLGVLTLLHLSGVPLNALVQAVKAISYDIKGRMQLRTFPSFLLVDDTYNANPTSFKSVITTLKDMYPHRRLVIVAGEMAELGDQSPQMHLHMGRLFYQAGVAYLFAFGNNDALQYAEGWQQEGGASKSVLWTNDLAMLTDVFEKQVQADDLILVKGSRAAHMERFVQAMIESFGELPTRS